MSKMIIRKFNKILFKPVKKRQSLLERIKDWINVVFKEWDKSLLVGIYFGIFIFSSTITSKSLWPFLWVRKRKKKKQQIIVLFSLSIPYSLKSLFLSFSHSLISKWWWLGCNDSQWGKWNLHTEFSFYLRERHESISSLTLNTAVKVKKKKFDRLSSLSAIGNQSRMVDFKFKKNRFKRIEIFKLSSYSTKSAFVFLERHEHISPPPSSSSK